MNNLQKIYLTLQEGEGFSVNSNFTSYIGGGYAVGGYSHVFKSYNETISYIVFKRIMDEFAEMLISQDEKNVVIGGWVDDDGMTYVEVSNIVYDLQIAIDLAKVRGELAIFDFDNFKEVRL